MSHKAQHPRLPVKRIAGAAFASALLAATALPQATSQQAESILALLVPSANATDLFVEPSGVGIGVQVPQRMLHIKGPNAVVRIDRPSDATTFMLVRTDSTGNNVWKTYSVGVRSSGPGVGEFVIQDFGTATAGASQRRMTITSEGEVHFNGIVRAPQFVSTSSIEFKDGIKPISNANEALSSLRGVHFNWKEDGKPSIGLIAEEVAEVFPEVVELNHNGRPAAVNYSALVAVLVEALKAQQTQLAEQKSQIASLLALADERNAQLPVAADPSPQIKDVQGELVAIRDRLADLERTLVDETSATVASR